MRKLPEVADTDPLSQPSAFRRQESYQDLVRLYVTKKNANTSVLFCQNREMNYLEGVR